MKFIHTGDIHLGAHPENKKEWAAKKRRRNLGIL